MIFLEEIAKKLAADGFGTIGATVDGIFVHHMPDEIETGVLLINRLAGTTRYNDLPNYRKTTFSVICRGKERKVLVDKCHLIAEGLNTNAIFTLGGIRFNYIHATSDPMLLPESDGGILEVASMFGTAFVIQDYNY